MTRQPPSNNELRIRLCAEQDLGHIRRLDTQRIGAAKSDYWATIFDRYVRRQIHGRHFLVAEDAGAIVGFIVGEVRAWEFGSPPTGWVFAINVAGERREGGIASLLLAEICHRFRADGADVVRTMVSRDDPLILSFFRSQGLTAGPYIELEKHL